MKKLLKSFSYALQGIRVVVGTQRNMKIHLVVAIIVVIAGFFFHISIQEWLILIVTILLVFTLEMVNTAIEKVVDLVSPEYHRLAGQAKDIAAGAVFLAALGAVVIGILLFGPAILRFFCTF